MTEIKPNSMLLINTPQVDYILNDKSGVWVNGALQAERNILDQIFVMGYMNAMQFVGITVDFFSSMAKLFKENGGTEINCYTNKLHRIHITHYKYLIQYISFGL
jgi:hypothetical protein